MKLKYIPLTILLAALTTGCNESRFLDITPSATLNGDNVATKENVHLLTTAAYSALGGVVKDNSLCLSPMTNWTYGSVRSDDAYKGGGGTADGDNGNMHRYEVFTVDATVGNVDSKWFQLYCCLQRCNTALKALNNIAESELPDVEIQKAEMRVLRAHFFFELSRLSTRFLTSTRTWKSISTNTSATCNTPTTKSWA